jgi:excisionase family DNA binding protein|tara:strand:+ start:458 stop:676 length:219 start_codon:yes stop_codon:yes gene_type:complete
MPNGNQLLTIKEVAHYLQVNRKTVRKWIKEEELPCFRVNPTVLRFAKKDILEWLNKRTSFYVDSIIRGDNNV